MKTNLIQTNNEKIVECVPGETVIETEQDILDLIGLCGENDTNLILFHESNFTPAFYDLKTGLLGAIFQKFSNYHVKAAAVVDFRNITGGRFKEFMSECNKGGQFHFYGDKKDAVNWLAS